MIASSNGLPSQENLRVVVGKLEQLEQTRKKLQRIGELLTQSTVFAVFIVLVALTTRNFSVNISFYVFSIAVVFIALFSTLAAFQFDKLKRHGEIIYAEIADELQGKTEDELPKQADLETRIAMRAFIYDSNLPLVQTRNAAAIYVAVNLIAVVLSLLFLRS